MPSRVTPPHLPPSRNRSTAAEPSGPLHWFAILGFGLAMLAALSIPAKAQPAVDTSAAQAILLDMETGSILLSKEADSPMPTSSMSKIMTIYMLFEALEDGRLSLDESLPVSEYAWRKGGSKMFVEVGTEVRVEDLIRGIVVQSGNDASIVIAEALGGTEEGFAQAMTERARQMGMENTNFANATGWPDPNHYSTARDLAVLSQRLILDFPQYYHYFARPNSPSARSARATAIRCCTGISAPTDSRPAIPKMPAMGWRPRLYRTTAGWCWCSTACPASTPAPTRAPG